MVPHQTDIVSTPRVPKAFIQFLFLWVSWIAPRAFADMPYPASNYLYGQFTPLAGDPNQSRFNYRWLVPPTYNSNSTFKHPLVIFWHGDGEKETNFVKGDPTIWNSAQLKDNGQFAFVRTNNQAIFPCFFLLVNSYWLGRESLTNSAMDLIRDLAARYKGTDGASKIDMDRLVITGISGGGGATLLHSARNPGFWAAAVTLSPPTSGVDFTNLAQSGLPLWWFHSTNDGIIGIGNGDTGTQKLRNAGGQPIYTRYELGGHSATCWAAAYNTPALIPWLAAQRRGQRSTTDPATLTVDVPANALSNIVDTNTITLTGGLTTTGTGALDPGITNIDFAAGTWTKSSRQDAQGTVTAWSTGSRALASNSNYMFQIVAVGTNWAPANKGNTFYSTTRFVTYIPGGITNISTAPVISVTPGNLMTNAPVTAQLAIDKGTGYFSTNGGTHWESFSPAGTNLVISNVTTLKYFGDDPGSGTTATNTVTWTVDLVKPTAVNLLSPATALNRGTNLVFSWSAATDNLAFGNYTLVLRTNGTGEWQRFSSLLSTNQTVSAPLLFSNVIQWAVFSKDLVGNTNASTNGTFLWNRIPDAPVSPPTANLTVTFTTQGLSVLEGKAVFRVQANKETADPMELAFEVSESGKAAWVTLGADALPGARSVTALRHSASLPWAVPAAWALKEKVDVRLTATLPGVTNVQALEGLDLRPLFATRENLDDVTVLNHPFWGQGPGIYLAALPANTTGEVYSLSGRKVGTLEVAPENPALRIWKISSTERPAPGVYFARLRSGTAGKTIRLLVAQP